MNIAEAIADYRTPHIRDHELLQFLIGKGVEKLDIPLNEAMRLEHSELVRKVGKRAATKLSAAFEFSRRAMTPRQRDLRIETPSDVFQLMRPRIGHLTQEVFYVLLLDSKHRLVRQVQVAQGGLASCALTARDVFEPVIREAAPAMIFVHNHPSGDPTPSADDILLTQRLVKGAQLLGLSILDHIVVTADGFTSLAEMGKM